MNGNQIIRINSPYCLTEKCKLLSMADYFLIPEHSCQELTEDLDAFFIEKSSAVAQYQLGISDSKVFNFLPISDNTGLSFVQSIAYADNSQQILANVCKIVNRKSLEAYDSILNTINNKYFEEPNNREIHYYYYCITVMLLRLGLINDDYKYTNKYARTSLENYFTKPKLCMIGRLFVHWELAVAYQNFIYNTSSSNVIMLQQHLELVIGLFEFGKNLIFNEDTITNIIGNSLHLLRNEVSFECHVSNREERADIIFSDEKLYVIIKIKVNPSNSQKGYEQAYKYALNKKKSETIYCLLAFFKEQDHNQRIRSAVIADVFERRNGKMEK